MLVSTKETPNPRDFLRGISQLWYAEVDALETTRRQAEEAEENGDGPQIRLQPFYMKRSHAQMLEDWAEDDSAWDEEWK